MQSALGTLGRVTNPLLAVCLGVLACGVPPAAAVDRLIVHEWGTFTSLQDEQGRELPGINTDDEPVPEFVHNLNPFLLSKPVLSSLHWQYRQKAAPRVHPFVTMRLETPVIYCYPPAAWPADKSLDITVQFRGGWLTEFYPRAEANAPGLKEGQFNFGELTSETTSSLAWNGVKLGGQPPGPATDSPVWLAPRGVAAANVTAASGESERYLFYRGIGRLHAPLRAVMDRKSGQLALHANFDDVLSTRQSEQIPVLWLVQVRSDRECAVRTINGFSVSSDSSAELAKLSYHFQPNEFQGDSQQRLITEMRAALVADGLYADEANALLATWQKSYFHSPGLRLFYLVPRTWTNHYLPLTVTGDPQVERVMVGRLELISDEQRGLLDRMASAKVSDGKWVLKIPESPARERFFAGRSDCGDLGVPIPADYQTYLDLGRFRNALVAHEESIRPTKSLTAFINNYQLHPFRIPAASTTSTGP